MLKKLTLLAVAVGAIVALAAPASVIATISANAEHEEMYTAKSTNLVTETAASNLECSTTTIEGELGYPTEVEEIPATSPTMKAVGGGGMLDDCATSVPKVTAMINPTVSNLKITSQWIEATTTMTVTYTDPTTSAIAVCHYHGKISLKYSHGAALVGTIDGTNQLEQQAHNTCPSATGTKMSVSGNFSFTKGTGGLGGALEITTP